MIMIKMTEDNDHNGSIEDFEKGLNACGFGQF